MAKVDDSAKVAIQSVTVDGKRRGEVDGRPITIEGEDRSLYSLQAVDGLGRRTVQEAVTEIYYPYFQGITSEHVQFASKPSCDFSADWTFDFTIRTPSSWSDGNYHLFTFVDGDGGCHARMNVASGVGSLTFQVNDFNTLTGGDWEKNPTAVGTDTDLRVVGSWTSGTLSITFNGEASGTGSAIPAGLANLVLGNVAVAGSLPFKGTVKEFQLADLELTIPAVQNGFTLFDQGGGSNNGTIVGVDLETFWVTDV